MLTSPKKDAQLPTVAILRYRFLPCWCLGKSLPKCQPCSLLFVFVPLSGTCDGIRIPIDSLDEFILAIRLRRINRLIYPSETDKLSRYKSSLKTNYLTLFGVFRWLVCQHFLKPCCMTDESAEDKFGHVIRLNTGFILWRYIRHRQTLTGVRRLLRLWYKFGHELLLTRSMFCILSELSINDMSKYGSLIGCTWMDKKTKNGIIRNANFMPVTLLKTEVRISVEDKSLSSDQSLFLDWA